MSRLASLRLQNQRAELQRRYDTLTKRIAALDTDIGREMDSERKWSLQERRDELATERNEVMAKLDDFDDWLVQQRVVNDQEIQEPVAVDDASSKATPAIDTKNLESKKRQLDNLRANLRLIEERKAEFVFESDIPLQLIREERRLEGRIAELERQLRGNR